MSERPRVSIIIVSYNTREMTLECLRSVFAETRDSFELIVLDNASVDGSADAIDTAFGARVRLIRSERNLGFAGGNNAAANDARGDFLLLLNPDTVVLDGAIDRLLAFAGRKPEAGIWGGRTVDGERRLDPTSCWARMTPFSVACMAVGASGTFRRSGFWNAEGMGDWARDSERPVDIVTGCFLLITRELWQRLGGFDPQFFMYGEEADLCLRARTLGAQPWFTPAAEIVHYGGASERVRADQLIRLLTAKVQLIRTHWRPGWRPFGEWMLRVWVMRSLLQRWLRRAGTASAWREVWSRRIEWLSPASLRARPNGGAAA